MFNTNQLFMAVCSLYTQTTCVLFYKCNTHNIILYIIIIKHNRHNAFALCSHSVIPFAAVCCSYDGDTMIEPDRQGLPQSKTRWHAFIQIRISDFYNRHAVWSCYYFLRSKNCDYKYCIANFNIITLPILHWCGSIFWPKWLPFWWSAFLEFDVLSYIYFIKHVSH